MNYFSSKNLSTSTVTPLKWLLICHIATCLASALFGPFLHHWDLPSITSVLALSHWGLKHHFFWQPLTHIFASPFNEVNMGLIFYLVFNMYFLWNIGQAMIQIKGLKDFLVLYLGGALVSGLVVTLYTLLSPTSMIAAGITPALYALLTAWMLLVPEMQLLLFFTIPVKVKWLILGILGAHLFIDISNGNFVNFLYYFSSISFSYLYCIISWNVRSPFSFLHPFENFMHTFFSGLKKMFKRNGLRKTNVYDFQTGKILYSKEKIKKGLFEGWKFKKISKKFKRKTDGS